MTRLCLQGLCFRGLRFRGLCFRGLRFRGLWSEVCVFETPRISRSQRSKVVYRANCWDCDSFYVGKTKRQLHVRKTEHFKAFSQGCHASALADHVISTGPNIEWDHFDILTTGKSDLQCKIKETLLISELKPSLNENVGSEKLFLY